MRSLSFAMESIETVPSLDQRALQAELDRRLTGLVSIDNIEFNIDRPYLVKGIINCGSMNTIVGPPGSGKTFFAIDMAGHIATGTNWCGRRVKSALVVYVAAEAGESILRRFHAWRCHKVDDSRKNPIPLEILTRGVNLLDSAEIGAFIEILRALEQKYGQKIGLVVFDTLSRSIPGGKENSPEDMSKVVKCVEMLRYEFGAAVVLIAHTGKNEEAGVRGHSSIHAGNDVEIRVKCNVATIVKSRDAEDGAELPFELKVIELGSDSDGDLQTTCVVDHQKGAPKKRKRKEPSKTGVIALRALQTMADGGKLPSSSVFPENARGCSLDTWRNEYYRTSGVDDKQKRTYFGRAKVDLLSKGHIRIFNEWVGLE